MSDTATQAHTYLERLGNLLRSEARSLGVRYGLQPVQMEALAYLGNCNRYSDTPLGVTDYLGLTKGTVSQTLKVLENKGLLRKQADKKDKRVVHLHLSAAGRNLLNKAVPAPAIRDACETLTATQQSAMLEGLSALLGAIQSGNGMKSFGVCKTCRHNEQRPAGEFYCKLTREPLSRGDVELICREHELEKA